MLSPSGKGDRGVEPPRAAPVREVGVRTAGDGEYPVRVGAGVIAELPAMLAERARAHRYALIGDRRVLELHGETVTALLDAAGMPVRSFPFPEGEASKSREEWGRLTDRLLESGMGRDGCVLALGGGVSGDLAGFVAATFMRGIPLVQLPTSLVAMLDSSVGGKTGIDVPLGKNLVGAFHPPRFVLADTRFAATLPREERSQGLAEAVKHGAILDEAYLAWLEASAEALLSGEEETTTEAVARSVELKADVVSRDEHEGGMRQILNFGHTLGHALEAASGYALPHGSAVAVGMALEARLGEVLGVTAEGTAERIAAALRALHLPVSPPPALDPAPVLELLGRDKKVREGEVRFVLLDGIGRVHVGGEGGWSRSVPDEAIRGVLGRRPRSAI